MNKFFCVFAFLSVCLFCTGQYKLDTNYNFHPPLKIPLILAANFGELRTNHFHTGIDFKTNRAEGYSIYSIDDGYISRIKVSPWGYGHAVYIDHYNGLTSVYAHCSAFQGEIAKLAEDQQQKKQDFAIDYYPAKDSLKVTRGEMIALSGNTGGSTAPHLHFEIRETVSEHALNPLLFNFDVSDTRKPTIRGLKVYALTEKGYRINKKQKTYSVFGANGTYRINNNVVSIPAHFSSSTGGVGFSFDAIDQLDAAENICGIYQSFLIVNNDTIFSQDMTKIAFESNRYINCHKDYEAYHNQRKHYHKSFKTPHNPLPIYPAHYNNGILQVKPDSSYSIKYYCEDVHGNSSSLAFTLKVEPGESSNVTSLYGTSKEYLFPDSLFLEKDENVSLFFPPGLVYEPTPAKLNKKENNIHFGDHTIPLQEKYKLMLKIDELAYPEEKYIIKRKNKKGRSFSEGGVVKENWITAWINEFGSFSVEADTLPPLIYYKNFKNGQNVRGKQLFWRIRDDLSGIDDYDLFIDNEWYLLRYEPKGNGKFYFKPDTELKGEKKVKIVVKDACGNIREEEYTLLF